MRFDQAANQNLLEYAKNNGLKLDQRHSDEVYFFSPFRSETKASFCINVTKNKWFDHGLGQGGDLIELVRLMHGLPSRVAALGYLNSTQVGRPRKTAIVRIPEKKPLPAIKPLTNPILLDYAGSRGISAGVAGQWLGEVYYRPATQDRRVFALAFGNDAGGIELRNAKFKGCLGTKAMTTLRVRANTMGAISVFEGVFDFLSWIEHQGHADLPHDVVVLNSTVCVDHCIDLVTTTNYTHVHLYLDDDPTGHESTARIREGVRGPVIVDHSGLYRGQKDYSKYTCHALQPRL